jgi:hypothetical protein
LGVYEILKKKYEELKDDSETNQEDRDEDEPPTKKPRQTACHSFLEMMVQQVILNNLKME